jgi:hypothetical protein
MSDILKKLPNELKQLCFEYDSTYRDIFSKKVVEQIFMEEFVIVSEETSDLFNQKLVDSIEEAENDGEKWDYFNLGFEDGFFFSLCIPCEKIHEDTGLFSVLLYVENDCICCFGTNPIFDNQFIRVISAYHTIKYSDILYALTKKMKPRCNHQFLERIDSENGYFFEFSFGS